MDTSGAARLHGRVPSIGRRTNREKGPATPSPTSWAGLESLEPRLLLSGQDLTSLPGLNAGNKLLIVDADADAESLVASAASGATVYRLDNAAAGIPQVTRALAGRRDLEQVIILSHGSPGEIDLGGSLVAARQLREASGEIQLWREHLADDATIVLLGCDVAAEAAGEQFVALLAELSGADVAASTNPTGRGGDWTLEYRTGGADAELPFDAEAMEQFALSQSLYAADAYEPNETFETAHYMGQFTGTLIYNGTIHTTSDEDYYSFYTQQTGTASHYVRMDLVDGAGTTPYDIDMRLLDSGGSEVGSSTGTGMSEQISLNGLPAGLYYLRVYGFSDSMNAYTLTFVTPEALPTLTVSGGTTAYKAGLGAVAVDPGLSVTGLGSGTASSAGVSIVSGLKTTEDRLQLPVVEGISTSYDTGSGVLSITSISGARTFSQWQAVLRQVEYTNTQSPFATLSNRSVRFTLGGVSSSSKTVSLDLPIDSAIRARIEEAFEVVETVGDGIVNLAGLPMYDDQTEVPYTGGRTVTDLFYPHLDELDASGNPVADYGRSIQPQQIGSFLAVSDAVAAYLDGAGDAATAAGLNAAIAARLASIVDGASPMIEVDVQFVKPADTDARSIQVSIAIQTSKGDSQALDLGDVLSDLNLRLPDGPTVSVGGGAAIELSISADLAGHTYGGALAQNKLTLAFATLDAIAGFAFGGMDTTVEVGVIRGQIADGSGTVAARFPVTFPGAASRTLDNWAGGVGAVSGFGARTGTAEITLPISASIGGVTATTGATSLTVADDDIFDSAAATYSTTDFDKLQFFATLTVENIIQEILNVGGLYESLGNSGEGLFGLGVPFVTDTTLGDLLDFRAVFDEAVGSQVDVVEAVINTPGRDELTDPRLPLSADAEPKASMWSDLRAGFQFGVVVNNDWPVVSATVAADNSRQTLDDLAADLTAALTAAGLDIEAANVSNKLVFTATDVSVQHFAIVPQAPAAARLAPTAPPGDLNTLAVGTAYYFQVTGTTAGTVKGTNYYTLDTSVAAAAVHAGLLADGQAGVVKVTRVGALAVWGSTRNGIASSDAASQQVFLVESADADIRRLGVVSQDGSLGVLELLTQGTLRASLPLEADLSGEAALQVTVGGSTYEVTVPDNARADRLTTLADVRSALQSAGIASTLLDARLVNGQGNAAGETPDADSDYYLQLFLPTGSAASTFSVAPVSDILACKLLPLGFLVGEASASPRPEALRTFEDFQNAALFPDITITPVYDNVANTVTLRFKAARTLDELARAAGAGFDISPLSGFAPADGAAVDFSPTVEIAFGLEFRIAPTSPVILTAGADAPSNGRLSSSAGFTVDLVLDDRYDATVPKAWTDANADVQDLIGDVNRALKQAVDSLGATVDLTADRLVARRNGDNNRLELVTAVPTNAGAAISVAHTNGRLSEDLVAPFTHDGVNYVLTVRAADTADNASWADLLGDIDEALSGVTIDANGSGAADSGEAQTSLAASVFATTVSDAAGARVNEFGLFATDPAGAAWPAVMNVLADGTAVSELGFTDGTDATSVRVTASGTAAAPLLRNHTDGSAFASGTVAAAVPSFAGTVRYGFNTLDFAGVSDGSIDLKAAVRIADGADLTTRDAGSDLEAAFQRTLTGSDGTGSAAACAVLTDITSASGADIEAGATIRIAIPDAGDTTVVVEQAIGLPIPVPQANADGTLSGDATVNFLYDGAKYSVTVTAAAAAGNTTFAQLAAQFDAALAASTKTVLGVATGGFDASGMFAIADDDGQIEVRAKVSADNPDYATVTFLPDLSAFGEVGLQGAFGLDTVVESLIDSLSVFDTVQDGLGQFSGFCLPLINTPLSAMIDIKGDLLARLARLGDMSVSTPADLAGAIAAALGVPSACVNVAFDADNSAYRIDYQFETGLLTTRPLDITLSDFYRFTDQTPPDGLSRLVDTGSACPLTVKVLAVSVLSVGIDLTDPNQPRTFLYGHDGSDDWRLADGSANGTSFQVLLEIAGQNINFTAALGAFGVFVRDGSVQLGGPAVMAGDQPVYEYDDDAHQLHPLTGSDAAVLTATLADGRFYLDAAPAEPDALDLDNYAATFAGTVDVNLPLYTPTEFINPFTNRTVEVFLPGDGPTEVHPGGNLVDIKIVDLDPFEAAADALGDAQAEIGRIYSTAADEDRGLTQEESDRVGELTASIADLRSSGVVEIYTPDVEDANSGIRAPTLFDLLRDPAILLDGLDIFLGAVETGLRGLDNLNLPVIGPVLGSAADGVFDWRSGWLLDLKQKMRGQGEAVLEIARDEIYDFLGPSGLDLLLKDNGVRSVSGMLPADSPDDITLDFVDADGNKLTDMGGYGAYGVEFKLRLGSVLLDTGANLDFDFSALAPALSLSLDGGLDFKLGWDLTLGFGINLDDGFYFIVDSDPTANELELRFEAYLRGEQADYDVVADAASPTGFTIVDGDGNPVYGPRKGDGSRDVLRATAVLADGSDAPEGTGPETINGCRNTTPGGPLIDEDLVYWVVAAEGDDGQWVPAYLDALGYFRPQQGEDWEAFNGSDSRNGDEMVLFDRTGPLALHGELFFLQLDVRDTIQRGLEPKGDADYFYDPSAASTITAYGRNDADNGVNRNNGLPTRIAGRIGVNISDPSSSAGDRVARPGPTETGFMLMDGSDALGGQPVLDEQGNLIPVQYTDGQWYVMIEQDGNLAPDGLITDDPSANHITFAEMRQAGTSLFELDLGAEAVVNLGLTLYVSDDADIPRLTATFNLDWRTDSMTPPANPFAATSQQKLDLVPEVGINDIRLDMGSFLTRLIKPIAEKIDDALKPIDPLIDVLATPIPVISDIAGRSIRLTDLLLTFGGPKGQALATVIDMVVLVRQLSGVMAAVPDDTNVYLPIGNFWLAKVGAGPLGQPGLGTQIYYDNSEVSAPSITQRNQSLIAEPGGGAGAVTDALGAMDQLDRETSTQQGITNRSQRGGLSVPILQDPISVFKLLMGQDVPLVTFSLPTLDFSFSTSIPLVRILILEVGLRFDFQVRGQLKMGYDTYGIRMFHESRDPADLLDGFYVSDRANADGTGADVDEFYVRSTIALYGGVDVALARAGIEGGFTFTASVNLNDPNNDGKLRLPEMIDLVEYTGNPLDLADLHFSGEVYARFYYWVGLRIWTPWKTYTVTLYSGGHTFARMTVFSFTREGNDGPPTFAGKATTVADDGTQYDNTLIINAGPSAPKRVSNQDPLHAADGNEWFEVWNDSPGSSTVHVRYRNFSGTQTQTFTGVSRVVFAGGAGNDTIDAGGLRGLPVDFDGGDGSDTLLLGSGSADELSVLTGGSGNDTIVVTGGGLVRIEGQDGNDVITAGTGTATIFGGGGNDTITGGGAGSANTVRFDGQFGVDTLVLDPLATVNLLDFTLASSAVAANLESDGSTVAAGDSNKATFDLAAVTEIRGTTARDTFAITNPVTRNANDGRGLVIRGGEGIDTYNVVGDDLSGLAADGITIDDGIYPTSCASVGEAKVCEFCGEILSIAVADAGAGYVSAPEVRITDPTGSGARAVAGIDADGRVTGIYVLDGGLGYTDPTVEMVSRTSVGDRLAYSSTSDADVTVDHGGNDGEDYRIISGGGSIKWVGWDRPGALRPDNYGTSEMDNLDFNLPNAALVVDAGIDIQEALNVTGKRLVQNAFVTADTIRIATRRGLQINHALNATNNGDIVLRVTGQGLAGYAAALAQASAQASGGALTGVAVDDGGAYYDFAPIVSVLGPSGSGARARAVVDENGQVTAIVVTAPGEGYFTTPAPTVRIAPPASIQINAPLSSSTVGSQPGTGDGRGTFTLRADLGSIDMGGYVDFPAGSLIEWEDGDFAYRSSNSLDDITPAAYPDTVGGSGATAEAVLDGDGRVVAINVLTGGSGYSSEFLPAVEIEGMAEATAVVEGGQVAGFRITNPGYGYAVAPRVTIRPNGFGKIVGADADETALDRAHLKSANGYLVAAAYYGIGQPDQPLRADVRSIAAQTFGAGAGVHMLEKDALAVGLIDQVNGISTIDGDVSVALFGGTLSLGVPVQQTNASGQLLWQDANKTVPIYVVDEGGNIVYEGGRLMVGAARVRITADDVDVNSMISAAGGTLELQPVRFDTPIGLTGTRATGEAVVVGGQVTGFADLWGGRGYTSEPLVTMPPPGERAFGVAGILSGQVTGINLVYGGTRYNAENPPTVTLVGGAADGSTPADQATATAQYGPDGVVTGFTVTHAGSGYYTPPVVVVALPGEQATARAVVTDGVVTGLQVVSAGSNYAAAPTVTIAQPYVFNLDGDEIAYFQDGFNEVIIGRQDGSHTFYSPSATFQDNLLLRAPRTGGSFQTESLVVESGGGIIIVGPGHTYHLTSASPVTSGSFVEIDDSVRVDDGVDGQITATDSHVSIFGTGKGKIDGQAGSTTENLTITAATTITVTGAVGSSDPPTDLTLNSVGGQAISLQQDVTLDGDLHVVNSGTLSLGGNLVIGGDLIIDEADNVSFAGTVTVAGNLVISEAGTVNFAQNVQVGGDVIIGSLINPTAVASVTFASTARLDVTGSADVYAANQIIFGASVGRTSTPASVTLRSDAGDVAFQDVAAAGAVAVLKARDVTFVQELTTDTLTITDATGQVRFQRLATVGTADITATDFVQVQAGLQVTDGDVTITSNEIDFAGGTGTVVYTGAGSSTLTLQPRTVSRAVTVGSPPGMFTSLDLSDADLAAIGAGFERVAIGSVSAGTGAVTVGNVGSSQGAGNSQFLNDTSIHGGSITVVQNVDAAEGVDLLQLVARSGSIVINGALNSDATDRSAELRLQTLDPAGQVVINQPVRATDLIAIVSGGAVSAGASGTVTAPNLRITAGGAVTLNNNNAVTNLAIDAGDHDVTFRDDTGFAIASADGVSGLSSGTADTTLTGSGPVTQSAPITARDLLLLGTGGAYSLTNASNDVDVLAAATGSVSFRDADGLAIGSIGGTAGVTASAGAVNAEALAGDLTLPAGADIDADGPVALAASGRIYTAADVTTTGDDVSFNAPVTLTGDVAVSTGDGAGDVAFQTIDGAFALGVTAGTGSVVFGQVGGTAAPASLTVSSAAVVTFGDDVTTTGAQNVTAGTVRTNGVHTTSGADIIVAGALSMQDDTTLTTGGGAGNIATDAMAGNGHNLTLVSGGGTTTVNGDAAELGTLTLQADIAGATGAVSFLGDLQAEQLVTFGRAYDVRLLGDTTEVTAAAVLLNTGGVWLGDSADDVLTFTGGLSTTGSATNPLMTHLGGTVRSAGQQISLGAVELTVDSAVDTTNDGGSAGADVLLAGQVTGGFLLAVDAGTGGVTVDGEWNVGEASLAGAQVTLNESITADAITIDGNVVLGADVTLAASGDVTINGSISGGHTLTIQSAGGTVTINGSVDVGDALDIDAPAIRLNSETVETTGTQAYTGAVTLEQDTAMTCSTITFDGTLDGGQSLAITGDAVFNGAVGGEDELVFLTVSGTTDLNGGSVATSGLQTYTGAATLGAGTALSGSTVTFGGTLDGEQSLAITGNAVFNGAVGGGDELVSLTVSVTTALNGGSLDTSGIQTYMGAATLGADTALSGSTITFGAPLDGEHSLAITGNAVLNGAVGGSEALVLLTVSGTTKLNGGSVDTSGIQTYTGAATLGADTVLTGSVVTFHSTLDGEHSLAVAGDAVFNGAVGGGDELVFLTVSGTTELNGGSVDTSGIQTYTGAATLGADTVLTGSTVTFGDTLDGEQSLATTGNAVLNGAVGGGDALVILTVSGTTELNGGSVSTTGIQRYSGAATLGADATLTGSTVTFNSTLDGQHNLVITGNAVFNGAVGGSEAIVLLTVSGATALNGGSVGTSGIQTYTGAATLGADTVLTGSTVTFGATLDGEQNLAITGNAVFNAAVGGGDELVFLTVSGTTELNGGSVATSGVQTYTGAATLGADTSLSGSTITFGGTLDGGHSLAITGNAVLNGAVGGSEALVLLTVSGTTELNGGSVSTTGVQTYTGAATLGADTDLTGSTVTFSSTLDGQHSLGITGNAVFDGAVGGGDELVFVTVSGTTDLNGGSVDTSGIQTYTGAATLGADTVLTGSTVTFGGTLDGEHSLAIAGDAAFGAAVGDVDELVFVTVSGTTELNGGSVATSGAQTYTGAATLGADTTLTGSTVTFGGTLDGAHSLAITGNAVLNGAVGGSDALVLLTASGTMELNGGSVATSGAQTYTGAVTLDADTALTGSTVTFGDTLDGEQSLAITGNAVFNAAVGGGDGLVLLTVSGTTELNGGSVASSGVQTYTGAATLGADTVLTGSTVTFGGTLDGEWSLTITGNAVFNAAVGGSDALVILTVSGTTELNGASVDTSGIQTYTGAAPLGADTALTGSTITFGGTLDGEHSLAITGNAVFNGAVGGSDALVILTVSGTAELNGGSVDTSGIQTYTGAATLGTDTTLTGSTVTFDSTLDGQQSLAITGNAVFSAAVGDVDELVFVIVSGTTELNGGSVDTSGIQTYTGAATLGADTTLTGSTITFSSTLDGQHDLAVAGDAVFGAAVGEGHELVSLAVSGTTTLSGDVLAAAVTFTGDVEILDDLAISASAGLAMHGDLSGEFALAVDTGDADLLIAGETALAALTIGNAAEVELGAVTVDSLAQLAGTGTTVLAGPIIANAAGGLDIATGSVELRDDLTCPAGPVTMTAADAVTVAAGVHATAGGDVSITAVVEIVQADDARIVASGAASVDVFCDGDITVNGRIQSVSGDIHVCADHDGDGDGALVMASTANVTVTTTGGDITLCGCDVTLGADEFVVTIVTAEGGIAINGGEGGTVALANNDSRLEAGGEVRIGDADGGAGTPGQVELAGWIAGQTVAVRSLGQVNADGLRCQATGDIDVTADDGIVISNSLLVSLTGAINTTGDADGDEVGTTTLLNTRLVEGVTLPDLSAAVETYRTPAAVLAGQAGSARVTITNVGQLASRGRTDVLLYLSETTALDDTAVLLAVTNGVAAGLRPGRAKAVTLGFVLPGDLADGDYYLIAKLVPDINVSDVNVANNVAAAEEALLVRRCDLTPTAMISSLGDSALVGAGASATVTVANAGLVPARGTMQVRLYATTTGTLDGAVEVGRATAAAALQPDATMNVSVAIAMPGEAGEYRLLAVVDATDSFDEGNEANNTLLGETAIAVAERFVDLEAAVAGGTLPAAALAGTAGTVTVQMRNGGNAPASGAVTIDVFASTDDELDGGDVLIGTATARVLLAPEAVKAYRVNVALPADLDMGDYTLIARVTPVAPLTDANDDNDAGASDAAIAVTRPDLTATAIASTLADSVLTQAAAAATVTVTNGGLVRAAGAVQVRVYATTSGDLDGAVEVGRATANLSLGAGDTGDVAIGMTMPDAAGDYQLLAVVDAADGVAETDEANNTLLGEQTVTVAERLVDLEAAVAGSTLPAAALPGTAGTVTVQVRNGGNVSANGIATIDVFASTDDELDGGDVLIGTMTARLSLAPEAAGTYAVRVALPADLDTGDYTLIARVTAQAPLTDANGDNNAGASDEAIAVTRPDLTATSCTASFRDVALPGERGTVTVEFANAAQVAARGHVNLVVYATTSGGMDGAEEIGRRDNTPVNLAPGQAASARIAVRLPSAEGDWRILAVVDDGDAMPETDTDNNAVLSARAVGVRQAFVDLVTLDPGVRAAALQPGRRYSATVTLRNDGNITATGAVEIKLYASADRTLSVADTELVVVSGKRMTLRPGATRPFRVSFTLPAEMPAGDYYLLAGILPDPRLSFLELVDTNLANNVAAAAAPFTVAA